MKPTSAKASGLIVVFPAAPLVADGELFAVADAEPVGVAPLEPELMTDKEAELEEGVTVELTEGVKGVMLPRGIPEGRPVVTPVAPTVGRAALGSTVHPPAVDVGHAGRLVETVAA